MQKMTFHILLSLVSLSFASPSGSTGFGATRPDFTGDVLTRQSDRTKAALRRLLVTAFDPNEPIPDRLDHHQLCWRIENRWQLDPALKADYIQAVNHVDDPRLCSLLIHRLNQADVDVAKQALSSLASSEHPWVWHRALSEWFNMDQLGWSNDTIDVPESVRRRMALVLNPGFDPARQVQAIEDLPAFMTPALSHMDITAFRDLRRNMVALLGRERASRIDATYLRRLADETDLSKQVLDECLLDVVQDWNAWFEVDIAGVGVTLNSASLKASAGWRPRKEADWRRLLVQAVEWDKDHPLRKAVPIRIEGEILDKEGRGIEGITLRFEELVPQGRGSSRSVPSGTCVTDTRGRFVFTDVQEGGHYLAIIAIANNAERHLSYWWDRAGRFYTNSNNLPIQLHRP